MALLFLPVFYQPLNRTVFSPGVTLDHLNYNVLLCTPTVFTRWEYDLFNDIVMAVMGLLSVGTHLLHADTTGFSVHGDYDIKDDDDFRTI